MAPAELLDDCANQARLLPRGWNLAANQDEMALQRVCLKNRTLDEASAGRTYAMPCRGEPTDRSSGRVTSDEAVVADQEGKGAPSSLVACRPGYEARGRMGG